MKNIKAKLWRTYYWYFTDRFDDFDSLKDVLNQTYGYYGKK